MYSGFPPCSPHVLSNLFLLVCHLLFDSLSCLMCDNWSEWVWCEPDWCGWFEWTNWYRGLVICGTNILHGFWLFWQNEILFFTSWITMKIYLHWYYSGLPCIPLRWPQCNKYCMVETVSFLPKTKIWTKPRSSIIASDVAVRATVVELVLQW